MCVYVCVCVCVCINMCVYVCVCVCSIENKNFYSFMFALLQILSSLLLHLFGVQEVNFLEVNFNHINGFSKLYWKGSNIYMYQRQLRPTVCSR